MLTGTCQDDRNAPVLDLAHDLLQMPLNHLGLRMRSHDLQWGRPPDLDPKRVRAVITWFQGGEATPDWLWPWLQDNVAGTGLRVVHLGHFGPLSGPPLQDWLRGMGLGYDDRVLGDPSRVRVRFLADALCRYESAPVYARAHLGPWKVSPLLQSWVTTWDAREPDSQRVPVVTGPFGGIALQPWLLRIGGAAQDRRWYVDPFAFLTEALDLHGLPAPDPSVLWGRRMFVLHVDGDGFESVSTVGEGRICGEVFRDRIVDRYRLPMTVSVIVASLTDDYEVAEPTRRMRIASEILSRPWVEPASHSVLHPLDWRRHVRPRSLPRSVVWFMDLANYRHDMVAEVTGSIRFVNERLLPPGRRCRMMLWSGAANPTEESVHAATAAGCLNLNGGVYRYDLLHDSVGFVPAWGKQLGGEFQVYCGAPNENVYDGYFTTMPGAFRHVEQTLENTGDDRILKPANLYVHFYAAEHPPRLRVLEDLIERWAYREPTAPVFASTYAAAVLAAQNGCRLQRTATGWRFSDFGACRTVRFDSGYSALDFARSRGIGGARIVNGRLFVHLSAPEAELVWAGPGTAAGPHVEQANCALEGVTLHADGVDAIVVSQGPRLLVLSGLPPEAKLQITEDGRTREAASDRAGRLELRYPLPGRTAVQVRVL